MALLGRLLVGCGYGALPPSAAVASLLEVPVPELPPSPPGTAKAPQRRETAMTRCVRSVREHWVMGRRFPNPLQAVVLAAGFGLCFLLGGPERISAPTYSLIRESGGEVAWGLLYVVVSVGLFGMWRWCRHGLVAAYTVAAAGYLLFAAVTFRAAWTIPTVNYLATFLALWFFWVHAMAAVRETDEWRIERWAHDKRRHIKAWWRTRRHR